MNIYNIRKISGEPIKSNKVSQVKIKDQIVNIATTNNSKEYTGLIQELKKECFQIEIKESEIILYDKTFIIENFINFSIKHVKKELDYSPFTISYNIYKNGQLSKQHKYRDGNIKAINLGNIFRDDNGYPLWQTAREIYNKYWRDE